MSEQLIQEEKATVKYLQIGEVAPGLTPAVPAGLAAPAVALIYVQGGRRLLARYVRIADGSYRLEYVRDVI